MSRRDAAQTAIMTRQCPPHTTHLESLQFLLQEVQLVSDTESCSFFHCITHHCLSVLLHQPIHTITRTIIGVRSCFVLMAVQPKVVAVELGGMAWLIGGCWGVGA